MARVRARELVPGLPWRRHWPLLLPSVGRRLKWRMARGPVSFTLQSVAMTPSLTGRHRSVRITASDVDFNGFWLEHVGVRARDVRLRPNCVCAGSVKLEITLNQDGLDGLLENGLPYAKLHLDGEVGRAELLARPGWGSVELQPQVDADGLVLLPTAVRTPQGSRWSAPSRLLPRLRISSEVLLPGGRLTDALVSDDRLHLTAEMDDLQLPVFSGGEISAVVDVTDRSSAAPARA
jgi:LmeA-like phospholipid-binding